MFYVSIYFFSYFQIISFNYIICESQFVNQYYIESQL
jgi:hypothetical protein